MTTSVPRTKRSSAASRFRLPDPAEQQQDEKMTSAKHLGLTGASHHLIQHLVHPDTTIIGAELYIVRTPARNTAGARYPDLLVSFNAGPEAYYRSNGYIISEQGKPPDFVLENGVLPCLRSGDSREHLTGAQRGSKPEPALGTGTSGLVCAGNRAAHRHF